MSSHSTDEHTTVFDKIIDGSIPSEVVYETDEILAFRDINPAAPVHILVIPKRRIVNLLHAQDNDVELLGKLMLAAQEVAKQQELDDFRLVVNNGAGVGQTVFHLHLHILGGREFSWPPG